MVQLWDFTLYTHNHIHTLEKKIVPRNSVLSVNTVNLRSKSAVIYFQFCIWRCKLLNLHWSEVPIYSMIMKIYNYFYQNYMLNWIAKCMCTLNVHHVDLVHSAPCPVYSFFVVYLSVIFCIQNGWFFLSLTWGQWTSNAFVL